MKALLLLIGLFFFACTTQAQETITTTTDEMAAGIAESSDEYKILEATVGTWTYTMTIWPAASGPEPTQATGEAEGEWVLGGRFGVPRTTNRMPIRGFGFSRMTPPVSLF